MGRTVGANHAPFSHFLNPCIPGPLSPGFQGPQLAPESPLAPAFQTPFALGRGWGVAVQGGADRGSGEPGRFPCPPQGSPTKDCQIGLVSCQACQGQLPTGVPADCQPVGARGQQGAANRLSPHRPTVSQERPKSRSGNSGRPIRHGPGASRGVRQRSFCRSLLSLPSILSPFFCPGQPIGLLGTHPGSNSQSRRSNGLNALPGCKDRPHGSGLANQSIAFLWLL